MELVNLRRISAMSFAAACSRPISWPNVRISLAMSARDRGLMARKATGCSSIRPTTSFEKGTDPISSVGFSRITLSMSSFQQSPTSGLVPTRATALHHLLTATSSGPAPRDSRIDVTLGASETILCPAVSFRGGINRHSYVAGSQVEQSSKTVFGTFPEALRYAGAFKSRGIADKFTSHQKKRVGEDSLRRARDFIALFIRPLALS